MAMSPHAVRGSLDGRAIAEDPGAGHLAGGSLIDPQWMMDPKLELWVDTEADPVVVRLAGMLDRSTAASVLAVMGELLDQGRRDFTLETTTLRLGAGGADVLGDLEVLVQRYQGRLVNLGL